MILIEDQELFGRLWGDRRFSMTDIGKEFGFARIRDVKLHAKQLNLPARRFDLHQSRSQQAAVIMARAKRVMLPPEHVEALRCQNCRGISPRSRRGKCEWCGHLPPYQRNKKGRKRTR